MSVPADLREELRGLLWDEADRLGWMSLSSSTKTQYYSSWVRDPRIGGRLSRYVEASHVRVYLKDSLLKSYSIDRIGNRARPFRVLGIAQDAEIVERYVKPPGCRVADGRIVCWSNAREWKTTLMAVYERGFGTKERQHGVVFLGASGIYGDDSVRKMVEGAARRLGVSDVVWLEI